MGQKDGMDISALALIGINFGFLCFNSWRFFFFSEEGRKKPGTMTILYHTSPFVSLEGGFSEDDKRVGVSMYDRVALDDVAGKETESNKTEEVFKNIGLV